MRKLIIAFCVCIVILLAGYAGYRGYRIWKQRHMLAMAHEFLAKRDTRNAVLSTQEVLRVNPVNLDANRLMANLTEAARSPSALIWRSRVVYLNKTSTTDRLALAQTALLFKYNLTASNALDGIDDAGKKTAAYQNMAGAVAIQANRVEEAELHFLEAARLEPTNKIPQMNLAVIMLHGSNSLEQAQARESLQHIAADPTVPGLHCPALRELVSDALRNKRNNDAEALSRTLLAQTNSAPEDRMVRLTVLQQTASPAFKPELAVFEREAGTNSAMVYELGNWLLAHDFAAEDVAWLQTLPKETAAEPTPFLIAADCRTVLKDWSGLQTSLQKEKWGDLEFVRHAFLARALREQGLTAAASGEWEQALASARNQKQTLVMLMSLANKWNFANEVEGILWTFVNQYPDEQWAYQMLSRVLAVQGETRPLLVLLGKQAKRAPSDLDTKNNVAMLALLLDATEYKPHDLAQDVYHKSPTNSAYASTYAFSLYLQKKNADALKVMEKLDPAQLQDPSVSGYYGLILKANGKTAEAKTYLGLSDKATLLPEERKLMSDAKVGA